MNIVIVDYGMGNLQSIYNALKHFNITPTLSHNAQEIVNADALILPGVGAFKEAMKNLEKHSLIDPLKLFVATNKPLLGICLGMQLLLQSSEEFGESKGLGFIEGKVKKLKPITKKLPHVSWTELEGDEERWKSSILNNITLQSDMYFVHSFAVHLSNKEEILATATYAQEQFCAALQRNNIYGCQFHPEKSSILGLNILKNFINIAKEVKNG